MRRLLANLGQRTLTALGIVIDEVPLHEVINVARHVRHEHEARVATRLVRSIGWSRGDFARPLYPVVPPLGEQ